MVKRYDIADDDDSGDVSMMEFEDGEYVTFAEYDALAARLAEADERHSRFNKAVGELSTQVVQLQDRLAALQSAAWDVCDVMQDALDTPEDADTKAIQAALDAMGELIPAQRPADRETGAT